ncbi:MAG TPA: hypothetical protein VHA35_23050 [Dongiaceae bacterium]|jgi:hypothetical protein|nr:hypothetical protein [Dongiaceae bacterium]
MLKSTFTALSATAILAGAVAGFSAGASAQDDMTAAWSKYQEAVRVAELCRDIRHDAGAWAKMGPYIDAKVNHEISGAERLTLIENAKSDARKVAKLKGCNSDDAKTYLSLYDTELAPLVK